MKLIPLTQGRDAIVDDEDFDWLNQWNWCYNKNKRKRHGYVRRSEHSNGYTKVYMHVTILKHHGLWAPGETDHINGCGCDNRKENLRCATYSQNGSNHTKRCNNISNVTGVYWEKARQKWHAFIKINGKMKGLGRFSSKQDAAIVRQVAEVQYFGTFRHDPKARCPNPNCPDCNERISLIESLEDVC